MYVDANSTIDGNARYAYLIKNGTITLAQGIGFYSGNFSNTPAEHLACDIGYRIIKIMCRRLKVKISKLTLYTDSEIFIKESYRRPTHLKTQVCNNGKTEGYIIPIEYKWIPSKDNIADALLRESKPRN